MIELSRLQQLLQARKREQSCNLREAIVRCMELDRSHIRSRHKFLKLEEALTKLTAELAKALKALAQKHRDESPIQSTALLREVLTLKEAHILEKK